MFGRIKVRAGPAPFRNLVLKSDFTDGVDVPLELVQFNEHISNGARSLGNT